MTSNIKYATFNFSCGEKAWLLVTWPVRRLFALLWPREKKCNKEVEIYWDDEDDFSAADDTISVGADE